MQSSHPSIVKCQMQFAIFVFLMEQADRIASRILDLYDIIVCNISNKWETECLIYVSQYNTLAFAYTVEIGISVLSANMKAVDPVAHF